MSKCAYPAIILKPDTPNGLYGVVFPDIPGCTSAGRSVAEAAMEAMDALELALGGMDDDGIGLPQPTELDAALDRFLTDDPEANEQDVAAIQLVVATLPGKTQRYTITFDANLMARIDRIASNRSAFLTDAAKAELHRRVMADLS